MGSEMCIRDRHSIKAHADGVVEAVFFTEGELLGEGDIMIQLEEE